MQKILILIIATSILFATQITIQLPKKIRKSDIATYQKYEQITVAKPLLKKILQYNKTFAKTLLKNYSLSQEEKRFLQLKVTEALANIYKKRASEKFEPTELEIKSFYTEYKEQFKPIVEANLSLIALTSEKSAYDIYRKVQKNRKLFPTLAKKYSIDDTAIANGKTGTINIDTLPQPLREWILLHNAGDLSKPIQFGKYYFILWLHSLQTKAPTYENVKDSIRSLLMRLVKRKKMEQEYKRLKKEGL